MQKVGVTKMSSAYVNTMNHGNFSLRNSIKLDVLFKYFELHDFYIHCELLFQQDNQNINWMTISTQILLSDHNKCGYSHRSIQLSWHCSYLNEIKTKHTYCHA